MYISAHKHQQLLLAIQCCICLELAVRPVECKNTHLCCQDCILKYIDINKKQQCPVCKIEMTKAKIKVNQRLQTISQIVFNFQKIQSSPAKSIRKHHSVNRKLHTHQQEELSTATHIREQPIVIATSGITQNYMDDINKFCKMFNCKYSKTYTKSVTHLIVYPQFVEQDSIAQRTVKYLKAVVEGKWIMAYRWIVFSIVNQRIMDEQEYEVTGDTVDLGSPRYSRLRNGLNIFEGIQITVLQSKYNPNSSCTKEDLLFILRKAGSIISENAEIKVILYEDSDKIQEGEFVDYRWVFDCISRQRILSCGQYII